ncbi:MAG: HAMP domain-containing histidine kinase [Bdellovibrionales bacterium]|nr:HAMP domain-containing histidine kinase [Bdellovibrionales bacterium]
MADRRSSWQIYLALAWLVFTVSFASWWMVLGLNQIEQIRLLVHETTVQLDRQRRMMIYEGISWIVLLFAGGSWLTTLVYFEARRSRRLKEFFASFSHEVKTAITSLRLQAETLKEDLGNQSHPSLDRLVSDTVRLHLQLENSLFLSHERDYRLFIEDLSLDRLVQSVQTQWPQLRISLDRDVRLRADERALLTVLSNLANNAYVHGEAKSLEFKAQALDQGQVAVEFQDDGKGFEGEVDSLGKLFYRHNRKSGSGVGLYIAQDLLARMKGGLQFLPNNKGFAGKFWLGGKLV